MLHHLRNRGQERAAAKAFVALQRPYLNFTKSYIASTEQRQHDLRQLVVHPRIQAITFGRGSTENWTFDDGNLGHNVDWMFIGTTPVTIEHHDNRYAIGEFIVYLTRYDSDGEVRPGVLIENVTPIGSSHGGPQLDRYQEPAQQQTRHAHPHCFGPIGAFCMSDGTHEITNALIEGNIPEAFDFIDAALHSYGPDKPFCPIESWPTI